MRPQTAIKFARLLFAFVCMGLGSINGLSIITKLENGVSDFTYIGVLTGAGIGLVFAILLGVLDTALKNLSIRSFSNGTIGLMMGLLCAWLITRIPLEISDMKGNAWNPENWIAIGITALYCALGYLGTVIALRSNRQEFSLIIPYVRFRNDGEVRQSMVVDMETLIDGRLPMLFQTGFLEGTLTVQQETVEQLGQLAEQPDPLSRERGRRGLEGLETLKKLPQLEVSVHQEWHTQETTPEQRLVELAKILDARLLTTDGNLARMAQIQGVPAMNLSALAEGLRPTYSVGDNLNLTLTKEGKDDHQAVGYTPEGLMIVVNQARKRIGSTVAVTVSSTVQTTGGRLIFAELSKPKV